MKKKIITISIVLFLGIIFFSGTYAGNLKINIIGSNKVVINLDEDYIDKGAIALYNNEDISSKIIEKSNLNSHRVGNYDIVYEINYKGQNKKIKRDIKVIDHIKPEITLNGSNNIELFINDEYIEPGYEAKDNYDGDITDKVQIDSNLDISKPGEYLISYSVLDSSNNKTTVTRNIIVRDNPAQQIAVLNYHFFYGDGQSCNENICLYIGRFEEQLNYLKENGYKTLTIEEFRAWMYGEIELPEKSVLLTIDDGAFGTGKHNGNNLIPLLEKYNMHATLFLITGWWDIENYRSPNLDIQSHTFDMHTGNYCSGVNVGAQMLCLPYESVLEDLIKSIEITQSTTAFCYPFYAYNLTAINAVKEAGFKMAFAGGNRKASRESNLFAIPRYPIYDNTTLEQFISYIS